MVAGTARPHKRLVLVTQGTIANRDLSQVIAPALVALGGREELTLIVTTGAQQVEAIPVCNDTESML
jgi:hypothetical protein